MFVYFIQSVHGGLIKIGFSINLESRLSMLQLGSPVRLITIGIIEADEAERLELECHNKFRHLREYGEWFNPDSELLDYIQSNTTKYNAPIDAHLKKEGRCKGYAITKNRQCSHNAIYGEYCGIHRK